MRSDLNKQLCEHERSGSENSFRQRRRDRTFQYQDPDGEDARFHESMTLRYTNDRKSFNENLSPLKGQVRKAIGRPWNKFYSEFCQVFDKRSVINQHILQHLEDFVCTKVYVGRDNELWVKRYGSPELLDGSSIEIYVDPRDGIIKKNRGYKPYRSYNREALLKREAEERLELRRLDDNNVLRLIDGTWFHFELRDAPYGYYVSSWLNGYFYRTLDGVGAHDVYTKTYVLSVPGHPATRYHASKCTASKKLLKKAGLKK
jgi:hypothetical protein